MTFLIQSLGVLGILTTILIYQQKDHRHLLGWKLISDVFWLAHYFLLGASSAAAITVVAILRSIILLCKDHRWAQGTKWLWIFLATSLLLSILSWKDWTSLLATLSSLISIIAYWIGNPKLTRIISIPAGAMFLIHVALNGSLMGTLCASFIVISSVVGLFRLDLCKKQV